MVIVRCVSRVSWVSETWLPLLILKASIEFDLSHYTHTVRTDMVWGSMVVSIDSFCYLMPKITRYDVWETNTIVSLVILRSNNQERTNKWSLWWILIGERTISFPSLTIASYFICLQSFLYSPRLSFCCFVCNGHLSFVCLVDWPLSEMMMVFWSFSLSILPSRYTFFFLVWENGQLLVSSLWSIYNRFLENSSENFTLKMWKKNKF